MALNAYLMFNGDAEEVLEYYRSAFGGEIHLMRWAGSPAAGHAPAGWGEKVLHATLDAPNGVKVMASDTPEHHNAGDNFALAYHTNDSAKLRDVFSKLSAGGQVTMPLEKTFWSESFGMLTDKFGIKWIVNLDGEA